MEPIAIVGIACRFPRAANPLDFWRLLRTGEDAIREVPPDRWDLAAYFDPSPNTPGKMYARCGGFLDRIDGFDPAFFGISPREAERMDPQQRLLLELAWEGVEDAGESTEVLSGSRTGVFVGISYYDYALLQLTDAPAIDAYSATGCGLAIAANRISYHMNLRGPSAAYDTACSSSLVALSAACQSLASGESERALVGGVSLMLAPEPTIALC